MDRSKRYRQIIQQFPNVHLLVIGDLMLDEFIWGEVTRISPEAPVPVVLEKRHSFMPGGAANVAHNIASLGGKVSLCGVTGSDESARRLKELLQKRAIRMGAILTDPKRPTTLKTRVIAHHQQVVRIDREEAQPLSPSLRNRFIAEARKAAREADAVILEDYGKGLITPPLILSILQESRRGKKIVSVDPKQEHFSYYKGVTVITPNRQEAHAMVEALKGKVDGQEIPAVGKALLSQLACQAVLITLGEGGMCLCEKSGAVTHIPTVAQEVFDVSGAGDTVIAALTLSLAAGASMVDAARLANVAAGIVVGKVGVAVVDAHELLQRICAR